MNFNYLILALLAIPLLSACDNDDDVDTTKPVIEIESPVDHAHFHAGQDFDLIATFTDNDELASWKVSVHYNADGHDHQKSTSVSAEEATEVEWQQDWSGTIEASLKSYDLNQAMTIPANAEHGEYHLGVYALDNSGNEQVVFIEIEVEDAEHEH
jgi:hypothetical protein